MGARNFQHLLSLLLKRKLLRLKLEETANSSRVNPRSRKMPTETISATSCVADKMAKLRGWGSSAQSALRNEAMSCSSGAPSGSNNVSLPPCG